MGTGHRTRRISLATKFSLMSIGLILITSVGICLFVSCGIAQISLGEVSRGVAVLVVAAIVDLLIASLWSPLTMYLPTLIYR